MKQNWKIVTAIYMIMLTYVSLTTGQPPGQGMTVKQVLHNLAHVPAYALFAYLLVHCFDQFDSKTQVWSFAIAVIFGMMMEGLQMFVPNRFASLGDIVLNAMGAGFIIWGMRKNPGRFLGYHK